MASPAPARIADRYGRPASPGRRRGLLVGAGALLAAAVAWAGWAAVGQTGDGVTAKDVAFRVHGPTSVDVTFDVGVPAGGTRVVCTLRALNAGHAVVGLIDVEVTPEQAGTVRLTRTVPTSETAVTGVVKACAARP